MHRVCLEGSHKIEFPFLFFFGFEQGYALSFFFSKKLAF